MSFTLKLAKVFRNIYKGFADLKLLYANHMDINFRFGNGFIKSINEFSVIPNFIKAR